MKTPIIFAAILLAGTSSLATHVTASCTSGHPTAIDRAAQLLVNSGDPAVAAAIQDPFQDGGKVTIEIDGAFLIAKLQKAEKTKINGMLDDNSLAAAKKKATTMQNDLTSTAIKQRKSIVSICKGGDCPDLKQWMLIPITEKDQLRGHNIVSLDMPGLKLSYDEYNGLHLSKVEGDRPSTRRADMWMIEAASAGTTKDGLYHIIPREAVGMALMADLAMGVATVSTLVNTSDQGDMLPSRSNSPSTRITTQRTAGAWKITKVID